MKREEFNLLEINKQVEFFNERLKESNFNAICKEIGISKNTIKKRFAYNGFIEVKKGQIIKEFLKNSAKAPAEIKEKKDNKNISLEQRVKDLETEVKSIKEIIGKENSNINIIEVIQHFEGETVIKTFKIDKEVYRELEKLQKAFKGYKKQDVVSSLLQYAISNIK